MTITSVFSADMYRAIFQLLSKSHTINSRPFYLLYSTRRGKYSNLSKSLISLRRVLSIPFRMYHKNHLENGSPNDSGTDQKEFNVKKTIVSLPKSGKDVKSVAMLAASKIANGKIIAVPTDTIYGLACLVQNSSAVQDLYSIKGRHPNKPVSVCVAEICDIYQWGEVTVTPDLLEELLPGPVTLCFSRKRELNLEFNPDSSLVGIRIPDHFFVRELCRKVHSFDGCISPIALTSANVSGTDSCLEVHEFADILTSLPNNKLDTIFDGGRLGETMLSRLGSTIIDLSTKGYYKIIRQGSAEINTVKILRKHGLLEHIM